MKDSRAQIIISRDLVLPIKHIQGKRLLESKNGVLISFTQVVNDLLKEKLEELQVKN